MNWGRYGNHLKHLSAVLMTRRHVLAGSIGEYAIVGAVFFLATLLLTDAVLLHATHKLFIEGPGDGTVGFLWTMYADKGWTDILEHSNLVNYPVGESLANPTFITYSTLLIPLWILSRVLGPIAALNIVTFFGFFSCAMAMYWLVKKLTRDKMIAFFAGYAAAFVPYHIMKSSAHLAYIFSVVFVLIVAAFIGLWRRPDSWKRSLILAATIALAYYTDGYYLLIASVLVACLCVASIVYAVTFKQGLAKTKVWLVALIRAGVLLAVFCLPIAFVQLSQGDKVQSSLASARDNIQFELEYYASKRIDYLLPSVHHPLLKDNQTFQTMQQYKNSRSNSSENTLYIGYMVLVLCACGFALILSYLVSRSNATINKLSGSKKRDYIFISMLALIGVPVMLYCTLAPFINVAGVRVPTLSGLLVENNIALWRVMSRFFLPSHILLVLFAALTLSIAMQTSRVMKRQNQKRAHMLHIVVVSVILCATILEYASATSRPSFDFNHLPKAYQWVKTQKDIHVIAETPLLDRPLDVNYLFTTAQLVHGKKLINTHLTTNVVGGRTALGGADNPDVVDYALNRGADTLITHNEQCNKRTSWGELLLQDDNKVNSKEAPLYGSPICIYKINKPARSDHFFARLKKGTFSDGTMIFPDVKEEYSLIYGDRGVIQVRNELGQNVSGKARIEAGITSSPRSAKRFHGLWQISQDGKVVSEGTIPGTINGEVDASKDITIEVFGDDGKEPELYQIALSDIVVTKL